MYRKCGSCSIEKPDIVLGVCELCELKEQIVSLESENVILQKSLKEYNQQVNELESQLRELDIRCSCSSCESHDQLLISEKGGVE